MGIVLLESLGVSDAVIEGHAQKLAAMGHSLAVCERSADPTVQTRQIGHAEAVILANMPLAAEAVAAAPNLRFIDVAFTGVDHIPLDVCRERSIAVSNASGYATQAVAELTIGFMIDLLRSVDAAQVRCREGATKAGLPANLLAGKTVGIVGAGVIGKRVAQLAKAFGCCTLAHNRRPVSDPAIDESVSLDELLRRSDIVTLHCPLTADTKGLIGAEQLALMKPTALLINTARGPVVDADALAEALREGRIAGAACDVFDQEPPLPADCPLLHCPNILVTPHIGFYTAESMEERAEIVFDNLYAWLGGHQQNAVL